MRVPAAALVAAGVLLLAADAPSAHVDAVQLVSIYRPGATSPSWVPASAVSDVHDRRWDGSCVGVLQGVSVWVRCADFGVTR